MIGTSAGYNINSFGDAGSYNTFLGINAGYKIRSSRDNTFLGTNAGYMLENGRWNTIVGIDAGRGGNDNPYNYYGYNVYRNTMIGCQAGRNLKNGSDNVFIGYQAGYNETGSNKLYIANSSSNTIIYGDFSTGYLGFGTTTPMQKLHVSGGNALINNTFIGDVGHGANYAGFAHVNSASTTGYAFLQLADGTSTFINKKSGVGYIGFRVNNVDKMVLDNSGYVGIGTTTPTKTLEVNGDARVNGTLDASVFAGNLTGSVNGLTSGKIYQTDSGLVIAINGGNFRLTWNKDDQNIIIENTHKDEYCYYWYHSQSGALTGGGTGNIEPALSATIPDVSEGCGFEIHFGDQNGVSNCSVWLQVRKGRLVGQYTMFQ